MNSEDELDGILENHESLCADQSRACGDCRRLKAAIYDWLRAGIGEDEIKKIDNGHDCYEKFCDYCDGSIRDEVRQQIRERLGL